jgi:hypothetical protein
MQKIQTQSGSEIQTAKPLFTFTSRFDLLVPFPLALLSIGSDGLLQSVKHPRFIGSYLTRY